MTQAKQLVLSGLENLGTTQKDWTNNDWETPLKVSQKIASLVRPDEFDILEPAAGTGRLLLPYQERQGYSIVATELKHWRVVQGQKRCPWVMWYQANFFEFIFHEKFDLILSNPPFAFRMQFIERSLDLLKPNGRLLFLLPVDFYCGVEAGNNWLKLSKKCYIHKQYTFQRRIAYLNAQGQPQNSRQIYDAVFDIRLGDRDGSFALI